LTAGASKDAAVAFEFSKETRMRQPSGFMLGFLAWLTLEFVAFVAIAQAVGLGGALLLGIATSMAGFVMLRQAGNDAWAQLRAVMLGGESQPADMVEGLIGALAALLLILPGFASDLVGLALAAPSVRQFFGRKYGRAGASASGRRRQEPETIELAPGEWAPLDRPNEPMRR
jgi:UPF0716 protein FxsA